MAWFLVWLNFLLSFTCPLLILQQQRDLGDEQLVYALSFVLWLVGCLLVQGWRYYEHHYIVVEDDTEEIATMFEDETVKNNANNNLAREAETSVDDDGDVLTAPSDIEEPLLDRGLSSTHNNPYFESGRLFKPCLDEFHIPVFYSST